MIASMTATAVPISRGGEKVRYDMECDKCNKVFEVGCTLEEKAAHDSGQKKIRCPFCKRRPLKQVIMKPTRFSVK
jgi:hypothetical protein